MRGELLRDVTKGPQTASAAVHQADAQAKEFSDRDGGPGLRGGVPEGFAAELQGQALAGVTKGSGGLGTQLCRQAFAPRTEAVGPAGQGIFHDVAQMVIRVQSLEDEVPEGDQRSESPRVELSIREGQPGG